MELQPIQPFEPVRADTIPNGEHWIHQVKWDGVRVLTYFDGGQVKLINRNGNNRTAQYPEFIDITRYCMARSVILDGEIIALVDGKPSFQQVMKRDRLSSSFSIKQGMLEVPVTYMIFDILYCNGKWMTESPLRDRQELLQRIIVTQENVQLVHNFENGIRLFDAIKSKGLEGIVSKDLRMPYQVNGKDKRWQKVKNYLDLYAVVGGVTYRNNVVNSLLLGLYTDGEFQYIGHAGTGKLRHADWKALTNEIEPLLTEEAPFTNPPQQTERTRWVKPALTVKVQFMEWTDDNILRQPSIQAFADKPIKECTFAQS
ncbi:non-homologous end-joining DNA ligase [Bacillus tianshenii]|nr:non-homologous end-joining DNA ligase [Bacillus tianshenii]